MAAQYRSNAIRSLATNIPLRVRPKSAGLFPVGRDYDGRARAAGFLAVHYGRYFARIEGSDGAIVSRAAALTWIVENPQPMDGAPKPAA
jgi:hypothetical protein